MKTTRLNWIVLAAAAAVIGTTGLALATAEQETLTVGSKAPDFTRPAAGDNAPVSLHDFLGKKAVVVYFYPKDETPGCTKEACSFRDSYQSLKDAGAEVIGISGDTNESHKEFATHHSLPFVLLSDSDNSLQQLYHVPLLMGTLHGRVTYVIDKQGVIRLVFNSRDAEQHVKEATQMVKKLNEEK
jgi:thioredoxin-dependent peroxiredoxin